MTNTSPGYHLQRLYLKDLSLESPNAPEIFLKPWEPEIRMEMDNSIRKLEEEGLFDIQLKITVTARVEDKVAYIAEVVQGGIFSIQGYDGEQLKQITGSTCPETLYPYARAAISHIITQASFPTFLLTPVNFDYIYSRRLQSQAEEAAG